MDREVNGRSGRNAQQWRSRIGAWSRSGLTQIEFCKREKLSRSAFSYWKKKLNENDWKDGRNRLVEIPIRSSLDLSIGIGVTLRNGIRITIGEECSVGRLREVVQVLEDV